MRFVRLLCERGAFWEAAPPYEVALPKSLPLVPKGAHEGRAQCAKQAAVSPMKQGASQERFANGGGPKGWSGEHTERSTVRSHGTPGKRSAVRCERSEATMLNCGTVARRSRDGGIEKPLSQLR